MRMTKALDRLTLLATFLRIAERGSISAAARDLGLSQASASRQLADLEARLGTQLIRRTTHSLSLTDQGDACVRDARGLLHSWDALADRMAKQQSQLSGPIRVIAPVALGQRALVGAGAKFQAQHPDVTVSWELIDEDIRFAERGCDLWIKAGAVPDDTLVVRHVGQAERIVIASPGLAKESKIATPRDLTQVPWISLSVFEGHRFQLTRSGQAVQDVTAKPIMTTNNIFAVLEAARNGLGAAILPKWFIAQELKKKQLVDVLPGWQTQSVPIHLAYLPAASQPRRLSAFLAFMEQSLRDLSGLEVPS